MVAILVKCNTLNSTYYNEELHCQYPMVGILCDRTVAQECGESLLVYSCYNGIIGLVGFVFSILFLIRLFENEKVSSIKFSSYLRNVVAVRNFKFISGVYMKVMLCSLAKVFYSMDPQGMRGMLPVELTSFCRDLCSACIQGIVIDIWVQWTIIAIGFSTSPRIERTFRVLRRIMLLSLLVSCLLGSLEVVDVPANIKYLGGVNADIKFAKYVILAMNLFISSTGFFIVGLKLTRQTSGTLRPITSASPSTFKTPQNPSSGDNNLLSMTTNPKDSNEAISSANQAYRSRGGSSNFRPKGLLLRFWMVSLCCAVGFVYQAKTLLTLIGNCYYFDGKITSYMPSIIVSAGIFVTCFSVRQPRSHEGSMAKLTATSGKSLIKSKKITPNSFSPNLRESFLPVE